jgi:protein CpxP
MSHYTPRIDRLPAAMIARPVAGSARFARSVAITALMGATMLATPLVAAHAGGIVATPIQLAQAQTPATTPQAPPPAPSQAPAATGAQTPPAGDAAQAPAGDTAQTKAETVEQRISSLHDALQITPQQEPKWDRMARVMRDNAAAMEKLVAERDQQDPASITAVQDLTEYEKFSEAHLAGLRKLTASFETLYNSMPAAQKKVADQVFQTFGHHKSAAAHS